MGVLDPLFNGANKLFDGIDNAFEFIVNPKVNDEQATDEIAQILEDIQPADEISGAIVDTVEEFIIADLEDEGELTPENVEGIVDNVEGSAVGTLIGLGLIGSTVEASSLGQVDQQQEYLMQAVTALQLDDVSGTELKVRFAEGVEPALKAKMGKQHRAKFVALEDAVEYALRDKTADSGFLQGANVSDEAINRVGSDNPVNEANLIEEWGIRDDQLPILEEVAIREMEPEELLETPVEAGVFPDIDLIQQELDRAGVSEDVKELFTEVAEQLPRTTRAYEENPQADELIGRLDRLVSDGVLPPSEAASLVAFLNGPTQQELNLRWQRLAELPNGAPTRSQVEGGFTNGLIGLTRFTELIDRVDIDPTEHPYVIQEAILSELDGDLRTAVGLDLIGEGQYVEYAETAGLSDDVIDRLLAGDDLDDIAKENLQESADDGSLAVDVVSGVGSSRRQSLEAVGIDSVEALAGSSVDDVVEVVNVAESTAQGFIDRANVLLDG